jgi:hypothetical protein
VFKSARKYRWDVNAGEEMEISARVAPGRYCYAVWAFDQLGRPSSRPAWAWVDVTEPAKK